ncbi:MAG: VanW family protein [Bacillota bacterium]|nr:VanW family protein [Bacillota bacterium]
MATALGAVGRAARNIRLRQRARALNNRLFLLTLSLLLLASGAYLSYGPRVALDSKTLGVEVGGLRPQQAATLLEQAWTKYAPIRVQVRDGTLALSTSETGFRPDFKGSASAASSWLWWAKAPVHDIKGSFDDVAILKLAQRVDDGLPKPKDANLVIEGDIPRIVPSTDGLAFDSSQWKQALAACFNAGGTSLKAPLMTQRPQTTTESIAAMTIQRLLSSYTTKYAEDGSRSNNIKVAASKMSGVMLAPGEKLSFNDRVGPRSEELGYKEAHVFIGDRIEDDFGGGVCQVSTTLYNSLFMAGLEVLERSSHSMTVDYVPLGRDAAVAYGIVDLAFRNTTAGHVLIVAETKPGFITFKVFGDGPDHRVTVESKILSKTDFKIEVVPDPTLPLGQKEVTPGKVGYRVVAYKIVWDGQKEISRAVLNYSNYKPMKQVVKEGTKPF